MRQLIIAEGFGGEAENFGGEASPPPPPLDRTLIQSRVIASGHVLMHAYLVDMSGVARLWLSSSSKVLLMFISERATLLPWKIISAKIGKETLSIKYCLNNYPPASLLQK